MKDKDLLPGDLITVSTEAFLVWCVENSYQRWWVPFEIKALKAQNKKKEVEEKEANMENLMKPKWSNPKSGQAKFGGVSQEGQARFQELCTKIAKNRKDNKDAIMELEKDILKRVRAMKDRDAKEAEMAAKRNAKPKANVAKVVDEDPNFKEDDLEQWY